MISAQVLIMNQHIEEAGVAKPAKAVSYEMTTNIMSKSEPIHISIVGAEYALCGWRNPIARTVLFTGDPTCEACMKRAKEFNAKVRRK